MKKSGTIYPKRWWINELEMYFIFIKTSTRNSLCFTSYLQTAADYFKQCQLSIEIRFNFLQCVRDDKWANMEICSAFDAIFTSSFDLKNFLFLNIRICWRFSVYNISAFQKQLRPDLVQNILARFFLFAEIVLATKFSRHFYPDFLRSKLKMLKRIKLILYTFDSERKSFSSLRQRAPYKTQYAWFTVQWPLMLLSKLINKLFLLETEELPIIEVIQKAYPQN